MSVIILLIDNQFVHNCLKGKQRRWQQKWKIVHRDANTVLWLY